jgi:hypothetical protein
MMPGWGRKLQQVSPMALALFLQDHLYLQASSWHMAHPAIKFIALFLLLVLSYTAQAQTVYITKTGEKYHKDGCRYLSKSKITTTVPDARSSGYTPCSVCKPPAKVTNVTPKTETKTQTSTPTASKQCTGTTQAGNRCKRMTTNASGRCYQH